MPRTIAPADVPALLSPGQRVYVQAAAGEPTSLIAALKAAPEAAAGVTFVHPVVPGVNRTDLGALHETARIAATFCTRDLDESAASGRLDLMPLHWSETFRWLAERQDFDLALVQLAPPDRDGRCSFGVQGAFEPMAARRARRIVAVLNPLVPRSPGAPCLDLDELDFVVEAETPLPEMRSAAPDAVLQAIAGHVAGLVEDGDAIEFGIGTAPAAILAALHGRRNLRVHTGLISDAIVDLVEAGAVTGPVVTGLAIGTRRLYDWLGAGAAVEFRPASYTHSPLVIAGIPNFRAINSVIEVDLMGQANAEWLNGRQVAGIGGLADFARAARLSPGGRSILVLPSSAAGGTVSRIVDQLAPGTPVALGRADADYVVTEHGVAALRGLSVGERRKSLEKIIT